jgi:hypothetical protein
VVIIVIVIALLLAIAGAAAILVPRLMATDPDQPGGAHSPTEAVQGYLDALSKGDATTALLYSARQPTDTTFTTNEFLAELIDENPITDIVIPDGQPTTSPVTIQATYTLGGEEVQAHFTVQQHGKLWLLDGGFMSLNVSALRTIGVPLALNGISLDSQESLQLFPGMYTLTVDDPMFAIAEPSFTIAYPESKPAFTLGGLILSPDAISRIRVAAQTHLDNCLAKKELKPVGCGFGFAGVHTGTVNPSTISWSVPEDAASISSILPILDGDSHTMAFAEITIKVHFRAVSDDTFYLYDDWSVISQVRADFSDPEKILITFD